VYLSEYSDKNAVEYVRTIKRTLKGQKNAGYDDRVVDYAFFERFKWTQEQLDETSEDTIQSILLRWQVEAENTT